MKKIALLGLTLVSILSYSQVKSVKIPDRDIKIVMEPVKIDVQTIKYTFHQIKLQNRHWYKFNKVGLTMNQVSFSDWSAGGINTFSALSEAKFRRRYSQEKFFWDNELLLDFGINVQKDEGMKKTDDRFLISSTYGYRTSSGSDWFYSGKVSFESQFANGYNYPDKENAISRFMAPGYLNIGIGAEYAPQKEDLLLFLSPLTFKSTFVMDDKLSEEGAFGVEQGDKVKSEIGMAVSGHWNKEIFNNIKMANRLSLYSEYKTFGNVDVDWEFSLDMKINKYVTAKAGLHTKYDDDVKSVDGGPKVQLKQMFGVGLTYSF